MPCRISLVLALRLVVPAIPTCGELTRASWKRSCCENKPNTHKSSLNEDSYIQTGRIRNETSSSQFNTFLVESFQNLGKAPL